MGIRCFRVDVAKSIVIEHRQYLRFQYEMVSRNCVVARAVLSTLASQSFAPDWEWEQRAFIAIVHETEFKICIHYFSE